jgi:hypothetical protein
MPVFSGLLSKNSEQQDCWKKEGTYLLMGDPSNVKKLSQLSVRSVLATAEVI